MGRSHANREYIESAVHYTAAGIEMHTDTGGSCTIFHRSIIQRGFTIYILENAGDVYI